MQILLYQEMRYIGPDLPQRSAVLAFCEIPYTTTLASFTDSETQGICCAIVYLWFRLYDVLIIRPVERELFKTRQYTNDQMRR